MKYTEFLAMSQKDQRIYQLKQLFSNFGNGFVNFFKNLGFKFINFFKRLGNSFKEIGYAFKHGDIWTRLSFLFLGTSHIARGQIFKGISILLIEIVFIAYIALLGISWISGFFTLGTNPSYYFCGGYDSPHFSTQQAANAYCEEMFPGSRPQGVSGDNSFLFLLYGLIAILLVLAFIAFYVSTIKRSVEIQEQKEEGRHLNTFFEDMKEYLNGKFYKVLLFLPIAGVVIFTIVPLLDMILMAFTNYDSRHLSPIYLFNWVGLRNFQSLFSNQIENFSYTFWNILLWTLIWAFFATFLNYFLGMIVAMIINKKGIKFKKLWRGILVLSIAIPQFVSLLSVRMFLQENGMLQSFLRAIHFIGQSDVVRLLNEPLTARITIIVVNIWVGIPYTVLITSGILMNIPADLYESARIDGASPTKMYFKITLPYVLFITGPYLITQFVGNINNFNVIYFLTNGGTNDLSYFNAGKTDLLITWLYKLTVDKNEYSLGSVIGICSFIVCAILSLIAYRNSSSYMNEEEFA